MDAKRVKQELEARGMLFSIDCGKLAVDFPEGAMDDATRQWIREHKKALLEALQAEDIREQFGERAAIMEYDGSLPRPEAEQQAAVVAWHYCLAECGRGTFIAAMEDRREVLEFLAKRFGQEVIELWRRDQRRAA